MNQIIESCRQIIDNLQPIYKDCEIERVSFWFGEIIGALKKIIKEIENETQD